MLFVTETEFLAIKKEAAESPCQKNETYLYFKDSLFHAYHQSNNEFSGMAFASPAEALIYLRKEDHLSESDMQEGLHLKVQAEYQEFIKQQTESRNDRDLVSQAREIHIKNLLYEYVTSSQFLNDYEYWFFLALLCPETKVLDDAYQMSFKDRDVEISEFTLDEALHALDKID